MASSPSSLTAPVPASRLVPVLAIVLVWLLLRIVFFEGIWGGDDYFYMKFATLWNPPPENHLEGRFFINWLLRQSTLVFGDGQWAWALPALLSSLLALGCGLWAGFRHAGSRGLIAAGLLMATLPIDVLWSTTPNSSPVAAGLAMAATTILLYGSGLRSLAGAIVLAAMAILTHSTNVFYLLALAASGFLFLDRIRYAVFIVASIALFVCGDLAMNLAITGDAWTGFRMLSQWHDPETKMPLYSPAWFLYPLTHIVFSKELGIIPVLCLATLWWKPFSSFDSRLKTLACGALLTWFWFGYGTARPSNYEPFWRDVRFNHPLELALVVMLAVFLARQPRLWFATGLLGLCGLHLLLVAGSGPWGQRDDISADCLPFVRSHPEALFYTQPLTLRDLYMRNGYRKLDNIRDIEQVSAASLAADGERPRYLIDNPLAATPTNLANREQRVIQLPALELGEAVFRTQPVYRAVAMLVPKPLLLRTDFFIRRPAGAIRPIVTIRPPR